MSYSMFGADFGNSALDAAYDMMILDEIEKDDKEIILRKSYREEEDYASNEK